MPEDRCLCEGTSRYAVLVRSGEDPVTFDRETGEVLTWVHGGMSVGGDWRDPSTSDRIRAWFPEGTGDYV